MSGLPLLVGLGVEKSGTATRPWQVKRTVINLHDNGLSATNGATTVVRSFQHKQDALNKVTALSSAKTCHADGTVGPA